MRAAIHARARCDSQKSMMLAGNADAPVRNLDDGRPIAARDDAAALTLRMTAQGAPFVEGQNGIVVIDKPLPKLKPLGVDVLEALLSMLLGFGRFGGGTRCTARPLGFTKRHGLDPNDGNRPGKARTPYIIEGLELAGRFAARRIEPTAIGLGFPLLSHAPFINPGAMERSQNGRTFPAPRVKARRCTGPHSIYDRPVVVTRGNVLSFVNAQIIHVVSCDRRQIIHVVSCDRVAQLTQRDNLALATRDQRPKVIVPHCQRGAHLALVARSVVNARRSALMPGLIIQDLFDDVRQNPDIG